MKATQFCHKFLEFDGTRNGYQWFIKIEQFWNAQKLEEQQKFLDIKNFLRGRALAWFRLWKQYNPNADKSVFDIAFMHRYVPNSRSSLPEIFWNRVSDFDVILEEIRASLEKFLSTKKFQQKRIIEEEDPDLKPQLEQEISQQQQQNTKEEEQDEVTKLINGGERVQSGGDRSRSNDAEINVLEMRKESETVTDGSDWVHSSAEVVVSVKERMEATEPPDLNLKTVVTGGETQRKTDPSPCMTDGKAELHGAGNATDLSPVTVVLGETATVEMFKSACYGSMDAGGEHDASNSSAEDSAVAAERRRTLAARTPVATIREGATSMLGGGPRAESVRRAMLLNPPPLMTAVFPWDRAARTEPTADRCDGDGGMVQWRSPSLSSFGHGGKEGKRLPSTALSPTAMLGGAPRAMNQERDGYDYGYYYRGGNIWGMEEEQGLGGGRLLQEVPSNLLGILEWG
ncbi:hypothetical protein PIB30_039118 [Stylosanthes scabra]|uniref:Retrotransposon gag domain-containing protein n=1 Tax=Stylosanthes scabra TaxID=79078 RepID=A0ABU6RER7_9FABA|nr:hypothetical protein [Stylosanthes scabra]